jgi:hypothetical protein
MKTAQIEVPEGEIIALCQHYGIRKLALYGSVISSRFSDADVVRDALILYAEP